MHANHSRALYDALPWQGIRLVIFVATLVLMCWAIIQPTIVRNTGYHLGEGLVSFLFAVEVLWRVCLSREPINTSIVHMAECACATFCVCMVLFIVVWTYNAELHEILFIVLCFVQLVRMGMSVRQSWVQYNDRELLVNARVAAADEAELRAMGRVDL